MHLGKWASGPDGRVQLGALAIAAEHILGEVSFIRRPPDHWSLTTELTIAFFAPIEPGSALHMWGRPARMERSGGFAHGGILDERGRTVAIGTTRTLLVPSTHVPPAAQRDVAPVPESGSAAVSLDEYLQVDDGDEGVTDEQVHVRMADPSAWQNEFGTLHGGVWACLAEMAASRLVARIRPGLATATVHTTYVRSGTPGSLVTVSARALHLGSRLALSQCIGWSEDGTVCTVSSATARRVDEIAESDESGET